MSLSLSEVPNGSVRGRVIAAVGLTIRQGVIGDHAVEGGVTLEPVENSLSGDLIEHVG